MTNSTRRENHERRTWWILSEIDKMHVFYLYPNKGYYVRRLIESCSIRRCSIYIDISDISSATLDHRSLKFSISRLCSIVQDFSELAYRERVRLSWAMARCSMETTVFEPGSTGYKATALPSVLSRLILMKCLFVLNCLGWMGRCGGWAHSATPTYLT